MAKMLDQNLDIDLRFPHGSNVHKKLQDTAIRDDEIRGPLIRDVAEHYLEWRLDAEREPTLDVVQDATSHVQKQTALYQEYRDFLDDPRIDVFDSRGALQPSALEEFCYFLFRPLIVSSDDEIAAGHHEVYQGMYFTARNFAEFAVLPTPQYPVGNLDFIIGKRLTSTIGSDETQTTQPIFIPAVAVECKTYLDRPRWIESDILAFNIKRGFPRCLYIVISEFLKLDLTKVNVYGSPIDRVYVFRRSQNVDRQIRRSKGSGLTPLYLPAILDFFETVRDHLSDDWSAPEDWVETGILK